ncbi:MAG: flagellar export chaperone FliS [Candidatus Baltobacteraceae bacterium]
MKRSAEQKYLETSIATASQEDLIIKIFDVLVIASQQAYEKLNRERDDIESIHKALLRAQRACSLLMGSLDMEIGGELAKNLFRVYEFWHHELVMANMQKDPARVERVIGYAKDYRSTWMQAIAQFKTQKAVQMQESNGGMNSFAAVG